MIVSGLASLPVKVVIVPSQTVIAFGNGGEDMHLKESESHDATEDRHSQVGTNLGCLRIEFY